MSDNEKIKVKIQDDDEKITDEVENASINTEIQEDEIDDENGKTDPLTDDDATTIESAKEEAQQSYDKYLRISAEFDNYKKRITRETDEFRKYANESLISALLPVIDNLERAIESVKENACDSDSLIEGVELTLSEIIKVFAKYQVEPIKSMGKPFDPNFHQAMLQETSDEHPDNTILKELQKGYTIHNRLLRPAMVVVSKTTDK